MYTVLFRTWYICIHLHVCIRFDPTIQSFAYSFNWLLWVENVDLVDPILSLTLKSVAEEPHLIFQITCRLCIKWFILCFKCDCSNQWIYFLLLVDDSYGPFCITPFLICIEDNNCMHPTSGNDDEKGLYIYYAQFLAKKCR